MGFTDVSLLRISESARARILQDPLSSNLRVTYAVHLCGGGGGAGALSKATNSAFLIRE